MSNLEGISRSSDSANGLSRRGFIKAIAGGALLALGFGAAAASPLTNTLSKGQVMALAMMSHLNLALFKQYLGEKVQVRNGAAPLGELQLLEANDLASSRGAKTEAFSVIFRGARDRIIKQGTYTVSHPGLGEFQLFLVPVLPVKDGAYYEAIFNRLKV
jgi:hypothetical protein